MRRLLIAVAFAFAFTGSAHAAVPKLDAKAFYVVNASNGDLLAGSNAHARLPLARGQRISVRDLLAGALIQSANNAADALASAASGGNLTEFVGWMNQRARKLGLRDTHFVRPDGLDAPGHLSSARDVALL